MVKAKMAENKEQPSGRWLWVLGAALAIFLAIAAPKISIFGHSDHKPCGCADLRKYTGIVEDCCCDYKTVDSLNEELLHPLLQELVKTPFFRYFKEETRKDKETASLPDFAVEGHGAGVKRQRSLSDEELILTPRPPSDSKIKNDFRTLEVKLWCDCPFWPDDGMCRLRDCSICECPENEIPETFKKPFNRGLSSDKLVCQEEKPETIVDRTLDTKAFRGWIETDNPWTNDDETDNSEMTYVNLQLNPERYTGYTGPSARRIWDAIYTENCPKYPSEEFCPEKKVLYKLISGLHSSISIHIAADYLVDEANNLWGQNLEIVNDRVLKYPDRVKNLYFTFLFVLRAVTKASDYLEQAEYDTGNPSEDLKTQSLMKQLLYNPKLQAACPLPFDEAKLWQGQSEPELKQQIQKQFRNISALMDCVGCEKCRLWGKLQVLGLGTALKILFSVDGENHKDQPLQLQRNEVIALVNLLNRLSESVKLVHELGPTVEKIIGGQVSAPSPQSSILQRVRDFVVKTWSRSSI